MTSTNIITEAGKIAAQEELIAELNKKVGLLELRNRVLDNACTKAQHDYLNLLNDRQEKQATATTSDIFALTAKELDVLTKKYEKLLTKYSVLAASDIGTLTEELNIERSKVALVTQKLTNLVSFNTDEIERIKRDLATYNRMILTEDSEVWYWQPEGDNNLQSLVCPLVIHMSDFPAFIDRLDYLNDKTYEEMLPHL